MKRPAFMCLFISLCLTASLLPAQNVPSDSKSRSVISGAARLGGATIAPRATVQFDTGAQLPAVTPAANSDALFLSLVDAANAQRPDAPRAFMVVSSEMDPTTFLALAEDLDVMSYLLDKSLGADPGGSLSDMWIERTGRFGARGTQAMYLEGYGALFICSVKFPLTAPPASKEEKAESNTLWEQTLREIYGPSEQEQRPQTSVDVQPFDAAQVESLQKTLLTLLKQGTNLHIAPEEGITVAVRGGFLPLYVPLGRYGSSGGYGSDDTSSDFAQTGPSPSLYRRYGSDDTSSDPSGQSWPGWANSKEVPLGRSFASPTVLTIRAKKTDVDAFAQDKLALDAFRTRAKIYAYTTAAAFPPQHDPRGQKPAPRRQTQNRR